MTELERAASEYADKHFSNALDCHKHNIAFSAFCAGFKYARRMLLRLSAVENIKAVNNEKA